VTKVRHLRNQRVHDQLLQTGVITRKHYDVKVPMGPNLKTLDYLKEVLRSNPHLLKKEIVAIERRDRCTSGA